MSFGSPYFSIPEFTYIRPKTLNEALEMLDKYGEEARILAGGVGLIAFMKERLVSPKYVIDIKGIGDLKRLEYVEGKGLTIGAAVTFSELESYRPVREKYKALYQAIRGLADPIIRNRATLVGNLCEAIPWVDGPAPLIAYGAEVEIMDVNKSRRVPVEEFIKGFLQLDLEPTEIVTGIHVPDVPASVKSGFMKFNTGSEFALVNLAAYIREEENEWKDVRLVYGAVGYKPVRARGAERILSGGREINEVLIQAAEKASEEVEAISDALSFEDYRKHLVKVVTVKLLKKMLGGG